MTTRWIFISVLLLSLLPVKAIGQQNGSAPPSFETETLRLHRGKSTLVRSPERLTRVSVSDPAVASATSVSPNEIMIHGLGVGSATLILWNENGGERAMDLEVSFDLPTLQATLSGLFPEETISVIPSGSSLVLSGRVSSEAVSLQAVSVAETFAAGVVNLLQVETIDETILLQVQFAEVNRSALQEFGINLFSTGGLNTIGSTSTQQLGQLGANVGAVPASAGRGTDPAQPNLASGGIGNPLGGSPAVFGLNDLMNVFFFRPDLNVGATVRALEQRNLLQILAEPNIMAENGVEARFLAGGEFPFPIVQATAGGNSISILFKEFGVRLQFTPDVQADGTIRLKVAPEVSALDFTNALQISGFLIPALSTRRAETEVELRDGETFAIAGLIDQRTREAAAKVPVLGDIPIIGSMFRSRTERKDSTELLVMVTPRRVQALAPGEMPDGPEFTVPFLDDDEAFDGNVGEVPPAR